MLRHCITTINCLSDISRVVRGSIDIVVKQPLCTSWTPMLARVLFVFLLHPLYTFCILKAMLLVMGDHHRWRRHFNGEVFNVFWYYWYTGHPFIVAPADCIWFAWRTFPSNHVFYMGKFKPDIMSLKRCPRPGSNPQPRAPRSILIFASMRLWCFVPAEWRWFIKFSHHIACNEWNRQ